MSRPSSAIDPGRNNSEAQVVKAEVLPHDSTSVLGQGTCNPECKGDFLGERKPWTDLSIEDAREHVLGGGSIFVSGLPGVAKSYTCVDGGIEGNTSNHSKRTNSRGYS